MVSDLDEDLSAVPRCPVCSETVTVNGLGMVRPHLRVIGTKSLGQPARISDPCTGVGRRAVYGRKARA